MAGIRELIQFRERKVDASKSVRELLKAKLSALRTKRRKLRSPEFELDANLQKCNRES